MDFSTLLHTVFFFLIVLDPIGNIPIFVSALKDCDPLRQKQIILRELVFALVILLLFFFFGRGFFALLDIQSSSLQVVGSTTFLLIGVKMLFSQPKTAEKMKKNQEPFIVPLATPAVAGPGIIATVMVYAGNPELSNILVLTAIIIAWLLLLPCLMAAPFIKRILKENGIIAAERLFAYIVILVAVNLAVAGLTAIFTS